jgi:hypothetical protein
MQSQAASDAIENTAQSENYQLKGRPTLPLFPRSQTLWPSALLRPACLLLANPDC